MHGHGACNSAWMSRKRSFRGRLRFNWNLSSTDGPITVTGTLEGTAIRQCVRCLTEYSDPLFVTLYAEYLPQAGAGDQAGSGGTGPERSETRLPSRLSLLKRRKRKTKCICIRAITSTWCQWCASR